MISVQRLLRVPYVEGGRDMSGLDCWGMVRTAKKDFFNQNLPSFGSVIRGASMQKAFEIESKDHKFSEYKEGAIACVFGEAGGTLALLHVGIVINGKVLHTREKKGASHDSQQSFERLGIVRYYD